MPGGHPVPPLSKIELCVFLHIDERLSRLPRSRHTERLPHLTLLLGLALSALVALLLHDKIQSDARDRFDRTGKHLVTELQQHFQLPQFGLSGARGLYASQGQVGRAQFRAYVASLDLTREFPGVRGIGFVQRIDAKDEAAFTSQQRADGAPDYAVRHLARPTLPTRYPTQFIEPAANNLGALGLDLGSETRRRQGIERAVSTGQPTLTAPIALVQDAQQRPGLLLFMPVFRTDAPLATPDQRRAALLGLVYAPIVASELLADVFDGLGGQVEFMLQDTAETPATPQLVFDSRDQYQPDPGSHRSTAGTPAPAQARGQVHPSLFAGEHLVALPGRTMTLSVRSTAQADASVDRTSPWLVLGAGALASMFLAVLLRQQLTGRRRAEALAERMTANLAHMAMVARTTSNGVLITNVERRITWVNAAFEQLTGYTLADCTGRTPSELLRFEGTDPDAIQRIRQAVGAGVPFRGTVLNRGRNGRVFMIELEIQPVRNDEGEVTGFIDVQVDITERHAAEAALRSSRTFLDKAERIGGAGGWEYNTTTHEMKWSDQSCRILDLEPGHPASIDQWLSMCTPDARRAVEDAMARGLDADLQWDRELQLVTAKGRTIWVRSVAEAEITALGHVHLIGAMQDITARREMEAQVQSSALLMRAAIDAIDEAFVLYDADDRLVFCNDKYRAIYATSADLIVPGARFEDIVRAGAERGQYKEAIGRVDEWVAERMVAHRSGDTTLVQQIDDGRVLRIIERRMPDGHLVGFRIDITDLTRARDAAENANRTKSEFISTISHELRTPLQSVIGFSELGGHFAEGQPQLQEMFQEVHAGGTRMLTLVNGLLDLFKIEGTAGSLTLHRADLAALAADVIREVTPIAERRALRIVKPEPFGPLPAQVDTFRIQQVIRNVLANAMRFAPEGSAIELEARDLGSAGIELCVRDHGPGIPVAELDRIFEPFIQSSRTRDGSGGTGLGLTICRKIMSAHGGTIQAFNADDGGARMIIRLPAVDHSQDPDGSDEPGGSPADTAVTQPPGQTAESTRP
ncbi:MAG: hypothetical protein RL375_4170 [Pseudomonadota bacterium]